MEISLIQICTLVFNDFLFFFNLAQLETSDMLDALFDTKKIYAYIYDDVYVQSTKKNKHVVLSSSLINAKNVKKQTKHLIYFIKHNDRWKFPTMTEMNLQLN